MFSGLGHFTLTDMEKTLLKFWLSQLILGKQNIVLIAIKSYSQPIIGQLRLSDLSAGNLWRTSTI